MPLTFSTITPHPPIIIPIIGKGELKNVKKTVSAMERIKEDFKKAKPDTVIIISPHAPLLPDSFAISSSSPLSGNFKNFGDFKTQLQFENDLDLVQKIENEAKRENIEVTLNDNDFIDHGALVPLYYLSQSYKNFKLVHLSFSFKSLQDHFQYGKIIKKVIDKEKNKKIALIASGDLSHRITKNAPAGYNPDGAKFDQKLIELLKENKVKDILDLDPEFIENAGECGLRSIIILLGILANHSYKIEVLSYEAPYGVGYLVGKILFG